MSGFFGVDRYPCESADILCDISRPLPFNDNSVDEIYLDNVVEHIFDIPSLMKELVRICRNGAIITIITPHFTSLSSWKDPTHVHHLSYFSFDHFGKPSTLHYTGGGVRLINRNLSFGGSIFGLLGRLFFSIGPEWYERHVCFIFRASTLTFCLEVTK